MMTKRPMMMRAVRSFTLCTAWLAATMTAPHAAAAGPTAATPSVGLKPLRALLKERSDKHQTAGGCILLIHRGKLVMHEGFGYANLAKRTPFPKDAEVVIASISKPMLGTAIFRLVEQGKLDPDKPIGAYLPQFKGIKLESGESANRLPTVRELLGHTAGMRALRSKGGIPWYERWTYDKTLEQVVDRYAEAYPLQYQPGTKYRYSGIGTDVAARVAEVASSLPRNELIQRELSGPLGLKQTYYPDASRKPAAPLIRYYRDKKDSKLKPRSKRPLPAKNGYSSSGGAVRSSARDIATWLMMIRNAGLHQGQPYLPSQQVKAMLTRVKGSNKGAGGLSVTYGEKPNKLSRSLGGRVRLVGHTGSVGTFCWLDFERDLVGVVLTQTRSMDSGSFRKDVRALIDRLVPVEN